MNNLALNENKMLMGNSSFGGSQPSTEYSPSDYDSQSMAEGRTPRSQNSTPFGSQSPPIQQIQTNTSYRSEQSDPRDRTSYDNKLYPAALSTRSSSASYNGSMNGSQKGSYPDPAAGGQHPSNRVSWQNLNPSRSPSMTQVDPTLQQANPYRTSPGYQYAQLPSQPRQSQSTRPNPKVESQGQLYQSQNYPTPNHGPAELE